MQSDLFDAEYLSCTHLQLTPVHHFVDQLRFIDWHIKTEFTSIFLAFYRNNLFRLVVNIN